MAADVKRRYVSELVARGTCLAVYQVDGGRAILDPSFVTDISRGHGQSDHTGQVDCNDQAAIRKIGSGCHISPQQEVPTGGPPFGLKPNALSPRPTPPRHRPPPRPVYKPGATGAGPPHSYFAVLAL